MSTRSILISYAGYPYTFNSLMPDNGLANLAGALLCAGHETLVLDYGTVENVGAMFPQDASVIAEAAYSSALRSIQGGETFGQETLESFALLDAKLREMGRNRCRKVAEEIIEHVGNVRADFVGFKLWNGDGFTGSIEIAERLKSKCKNVRVFAGGPHVDIFRENIFEATDVFDALVISEGEETIVQLAEFVQGKRKLGDVDNVIFKQNGQVIATRLRRVDDLNTLPFPCYDEAVYPSMRGNSKIKTMVLDESRGCNFECHFCIHPLKSGRGVRCKKAARITKEMRQIMEQTGSRAFRYAGSSTPAYLAKQVANSIVADGMDVEYSAFGHCMTARPEYFRELRESGCRSLFFGLESGSESILSRAMGKPLKLDQARDVLRASKGAGIFTVVSVIFPAPFETEESEGETLALIRDIRPDSVVVLFPAIYPGTMWAIQKERFGFAFDETQYKGAAMTYKMKTLLPTAFWDDLPYRLCGRGFRAIMRETARFTTALEREGILTSVSDDLSLMAVLSGYEARERNLRDLGRFWFFTGDAQRIQEFVEAVYANAAARVLSEGGAVMNPDWQK